MYKGVSETQIKQLFKELAGVKDLPKPREIKGKASIDGKQGVIYAIKKSNGENLTLRNFSTSVNETKARWTIQTTASNGFKSEFKFQ